MAVASELNVRLGPGDAVDVVINRNAVLNTDVKEDF